MEYVKKLNILYLLAPTDNNFISFLEFETFINSLKYKDNWTVNKQVAIWKR